MSETKVVKCRFCGYAWETRSRMRLVSCPSCLHKVNIKESLADQLEHFNLDEKGVRILDRGLATEYSPRGRIVDIYFKDKKAWCEHDDSFDCKHIEYALSLPVVQEILKKKGWKIR